jgi:hypothetical protein
MRSVPAVPLFFVGFAYKIIIISVKPSSEMSSKIVDSDQNSYSYCEICQDSIGVEDIIKLACTHTFCQQCTLSYMDIASKSKKITFNHLFCPFRCGTCFNTASSLPIEISSKIETELALLRQVEEIAVNKLFEDGKLTDELIRTCKNINQYAMEQYSFYNCFECKNIFPLKAQCGAAEDEETINNYQYYCSNCTKKGGERQLLSVYIPKQRLDDSMSSFRQDLHICDSDENAQLQSTELEVLLSIYTEELFVLSPAPQSAGEPCGSYIIHATKSHMGSANDFNSKWRHLDDKISSKLSFKFILPSKYPLEAKPIIRLMYSDLSFADFDIHMRESLMAKMVHIC